MAKALAVCTCPKCGKTYERPVTGCNRASAEILMHYYERSSFLCFDCWQQEKAERLEAYHLPPLVGVSKKQISFASDLRIRFIFRHPEKFESVFKALRILSDPSALAKCAQKFGRPPQKMRSAIKKAIRKEIIFRRAFAILTTSNAAELIDSLLR